MSTMLEEPVLLEEEQRAAPPPAKLTLEQAEALAEGSPFELIEGRMVFKMTDFKHSQSAGLLFGELLIYLKNNPIGRVLPELTHRLWPENPNEGRVPDISIILNENLEPGKRYPTQAPDIAVEVISSKDIWTKLSEKARLYLEKGAREVWLVDPYEQDVHVITPTSRRWVGDVLTSPELPGFQVVLKDIFTWPEGES